ncbi:UNVERIFIED_ORG: hypothetical protein QOE_0068 [Clostridioides difficile F501]
MGSEFQASKRPVTAFGTFQLHLPRICAGPDHNDDRHPRIESTAVIFATQCLAPLSSQH